MLSLMSWIKPMLGGLKMMAAVAVVGGVMYLGWQHRDALVELAETRAEVGVYQSSLQRQTVRLEEEREARQRLEAVLAMREAERAITEQRYREVLGEIEQLRSDDEDVDAWAREPLPAALAERLRQPEPEGDHRDRDDP